MSVESIGQRVHQQAQKYGLEAPKKVVFVANFAAASYSIEDPRKHNPLRGLVATNMAGLANEILRQELLEMFPNVQIDFQNAELNNINPGTRQWGQLENADLILLSLATRNLNQGIQVARQFGDKIPLLVGGHHVTRNSISFHEQTDNLTGVVIGRAEGQLPEVLKSIAEGTHHGKTFSRGKFDASIDYHTLPRHGVKSRLPSPNASGVILEAGVGCEGRCDFCAILTFSSSDRDADQLIAEIKRIHRQGVNYLMFADDNISDRSTAFLDKVFSTINQLGMGWIGEGSRKILADPRVAKIVGRNNLGFLHGIEDEALSGRTGDKARSFSEIQADVEQLLDAGFMVVGSAVLGLDSHTFPDTFMQYRNSIYQLQIPVALHVATPYPGTAYNKQLEKEGRIFDRDPAHRDNGYMVFEPANMSPASFYAGFRWLQREIGSPEKALQVMSHVLSSVGQSKLQRVPRALASLSWLSIDQGFNGTDLTSPSALRHESQSLFNKAWDKFH